jgi:bifunctional non-homologous end joining protein LigD
MGANGIVVIAASSTSPMRTAFLSTNVARAPSMCLLWVESRHSVRVAHTHAEIFRSVGALGKAPATTANSEAVGLTITHRDLMLATPATKPFDRPGWVFELKLDGFRVLAIRDTKNARLLSRRGNDLSASFPEIVECLYLLPNSVLDGELVVLNDEGVPQFERLRRRALLKKHLSIEHAARVEPAAFFAFDILNLDGKDMRKLPLLKRKEALQKALAGSQRIRLVQHVGEGGQRLYEAASGLGLEGIVAKRADAPYKAGRSSDWLKIRTPHGRHVQAERSERWMR